MSQQTLDFPATANSSPTADSGHTGWAESGEFDDFSYVPVSPWGPITLVLGIGSLTGFFGIFGLGLAVIGIVIGIAAWARIRASAETVKGMKFVAVGLVLSVLSLTLGSAKMAHAYSTEVPEGHQRVNFPRDISDKQFVYYGSQRRLHPEVAPLVGEKIFIKGFMYQTQKDDGLTEFVFLKDNGECCFGGQPKPFDMMLVRMGEGETTRAYSGIVAVAGVLEADVAAGEGKPVYTIDATLVEEARTRF
ncbi:MAG: hypothetical protein R3C19_09465 [Planctomycetaceae bacterium]